MNAFFVSCSSFLAIVIPGCVAGGFAMRFAARKKFVNPFSDLKWFSTIMMVVCGLVMAGCSPKPSAQDEPLKKLAARVKALEADEEYYQAQINSLLQGQTNLRAAVFTNEKRLDYQFNMLLGNAVLLGEIQDKLAKTTPRAVVNSSAYHAPTITQGVPATVYNQIYEAAVKEWPGNYRMQKFTIDEQIDAYKKLHP